MPTGKRAPLSCCCQVQGYEGETRTKDRCHCGVHRGSWCHNLARSLPLPHLFGYLNKYKSDSHSDHPTPAAPASTSEEEQELHYDILSFQRMTSRNFQEQETMEYSEIKVGKRRPSPQPPSAEWSPEKASLRKMCVSLGNTCPGEERNRHPIIALSSLSVCAQL
ncbi:hypothetical protein HPG69_014031 [Diceros bicornis minor]|uniref:Uncharacterized protein n=1 Tax=Diceros bicornis minor TaxID=77932 RepID=A0A7J7EMT1_DICBM|nr:hypothetical protein HPG69_014031 [Diceros bicornis minor]